MNSVDPLSRFAAPAEEAPGELDAQPARNVPGSAASAPVAEIAASPDGTTPGDQGKPAPSANGSAQAPAKRPYPAPAEVLTQRGPKGLRFDFNDGCRVMLPEGEGAWRGRLTDLDTGNILFQTELKTRPGNSIKRDFIRFPAEICQKDT